MQLGTGGTERAGTACQRSDTRCSFSAGGFYAGQGGMDGNSNGAVSRYGGNGNRPHGDYEMAQ
ncbi:hypothetical protein BN170_1690010 [Clostridioides difficile T22]|nr:hypothetical protein BN170_1690010 [Clostridioides difficile T22]CCL18321.1 hypothetical protein BN171_2220008 [Clostridioides difficile E25]CCL22253.1 hypothetical protein BN172_3000010 [Clostridioides difficile T15]